MMRAFVGTITLLAALALSSASLLDSSFDPKRLRFIRAVKPDGNYSLFCPSVTVVFEFNVEIPVGYSHYNMLFRGDLPITNHTFVYDELVSTMTTAAKDAANLTFPAKFYLIDLSLLNPTELPDEIVEKNFFKNHPKLGQLFFFQSSRTVWQRMAKNLTNWQLDKLPDKMMLLDQFLSVKKDLPNIIYIHCEAGMDRTGEMSGSYYMHSLNMTFQHALAIDNSIETRNIGIATTSSIPQIHGVTASKSYKFSLLLKDEADKLV
eukprot:gene3631-6210_t